MVALLLVLLLFLAIFLNYLLATMPVNDDIFVVELIYIFLMFVMGWLKLFVFDQKEQAFHYAFNLNPLRLYIKGKFLFLWFLVWFLGIVANWIPDFLHYYQLFSEVVLKATFIGFNYYLGRVCFPLFTEEVLS